MKPRFLAGFPGTGLTVDVQNKAGKLPVSIIWLQKKTVLILKELGWKKAGLSLRILKDPAIRALNRKYLNHDYATDVIAFGQSKGRYSKKDKQAGFFLGDIVISWDTAKRQGPLYGHTPLFELCFYLCHGILHLMGYDDRSLEQRLRMHRLQKQILKKTGITNQEHKR